MLLPGPTLSPLGRSVRRRSSALAPTTGMALWLRADAGVLDGSGNPCSSVTSGTTDVVATWQDQSGNGYDATAASGHRAALKLGIVNGKPVVRFATGQYYSLLADIDLSDGFSIFVVQRTSGDCMLLGGLAINRQIRIGQGGSDVLSAYNGSNPLSSALSAPRADWSLVEYLWSGDTISFYENGHALGTGFFGTGGGMAIGQVGEQSTGTGSLTGDLAEILIYPTALSGTDRHATEAYLADKYGLTLAP